MHCCIIARRIVLALFAALFAFLVGPPTVRAQAALSVHVTMGNPSGAVADEEHADNYLIVHDEWVCSFNRSKGHPNWVSWRLAANDIGDADRSGLDFSPDSNIPADWPRIVKGLYSASGFDKFHLCPSKDRSRNRTEQRATFSTANCFPGAPRLNRGQWGQMEEFRRDRAAAGNELFIISGATGTAGRGAKGWRTSIGDDARQINVPAVAWAVWLELPEKDGNDLRRVTTDTPTHAVIFHNDETTPATWQDAEDSVSSIQQLTGFDFFSLVDSHTQRSLEARNARD